LQEKRSLTPIWSHWAKQQKKTAFEAVSFQQMLAIDGQTNRSNNQAEAQPMES